MHFSALLVTLVAPLALAMPAADVDAPTTNAIQRRDCFNDSGENWGSEYNYAVSLADTFCGEVQGTFSKNEVRFRCYNLNNKKKVDFALKYIGGDGSRYIGKAECLDGIVKEIHGCSYGGRSSYANWEYTSDPNAAQCAKN